MQQPSDQLIPADDVLNDILYSLQSQRYEIGGVYTIGGATGNYQVKSPYNTECEVCLYSVETNGVTPSSFAFSISNPGLTAPPTSATSINFGAISQGTEGSNPLEGVAGFVSANASNDYVPIWLPLGRGAIVYLATNVTGANNMVFALVAFRRSYAHMIPDGVRHLAPATHSRPYSRRDLRMVGQLSKQHSGFKNQYPNRQGGKEQYEHEEIPWEQDPRSSLTSMRGQGRSGR